MDVSKAPGWVSSSLKTARSKRNAHTGKAQQKSGEDAFWKKNMKRGASPTDKGGVGGGGGGGGGGEGGIT